jgi:hypothetical protein
MVGSGRGLIVVVMPWRFVAEATPPERASRQTPRATEDMCFFIYELLDSMNPWATDTRLSWLPLR